jgi:hypothetical protein
MPTHISVCRPAIAIESTKMAFRFRSSRHSCAATSPAAARFAPSRLTAALALAVPVLAWAQGTADIGSSSTSNAPQTITVSGRSAANAASVANHVRNVSVAGSAFATSTGQALEG